MVCEGRRDMATVVMMLRTLVRGEEGASLVEYAFIVLLMVVVSILVVANIGEYPASAFEDANSGFGGP